LLVAHPQILDVARPQPERRVRLGIDLKHAAELVELRDICRPKVGRERGEDLIERDVQGLRLYPVHLDAQLRRRSAKRGRGDPDRTLRLRIGDHGVGNALQLRQIRAAVAQLDLQSEAAGIADSLDRRRRDRGDSRIDARERLRQTAKQGEQAFALAPRLENHIGDAGIGQCGAVVEGGDPGNGDHLIDA
jgi:hypothetical protein